MVVTTQQGRTSRATVERFATVLAAGQSAAVSVPRGTGQAPVGILLSNAGDHLHIAEPIAAVYERGLVFHAGIFPKLEDQMCALSPDFDARSAGFSPDRADAKAGSSNAARIAMIAITTNNSIRVKPLARRRVAARLCSRTFRVHEEM